MRSEIARARMKHRGIIIQYMNLFDLCIMVVAVLVLLSVFICFVYVLFVLLSSRGPIESEDMRALWIICMFLIVLYLYCKGSDLTFIIKNKNTWINMFNPVMAITIL